MKRGDLYRVKRPNTPDKDPRAYRVYAVVSRQVVIDSAYSTVMGVATEVEVLRAVGIEPTLREAVRRRRELLKFLEAALR